MVRLKVKDVENINLRNVFQFHMVRLKVIILYSPDFTFLFQFHMVRLKVRKCRAVFPAALEFQFHMVRLKVPQRYDTTMPLLSFNSTWYD